MSEEQCRKAFEKWARHGNWASDFDRHKAGDYEDDATEYLWNAWQAAWNARHEAVKHTSALTESTTHDAEALVKKLEAIMHNKVHLNPQEMAYEMAINKAIIIIRNHYAGRAPDREAGDAGPLGVNTRPAPTTTKE
jgi:hypothetical protein